MSSQRLFVRRSALVAALALAFASNADANLVTNGGFEGAADTGTAPAYGNGSTDIPGWTVYFAPTTSPSANIQWVSNSNTYGTNHTRTPFGDAFLDLTGLADQAPYAGVYQQFATTAGQSYAVTFALGCQNDESNFKCPVSADVSVDGSAAQTFVLSSTAAGNQWGSFEYDFTATGETSTLRFLGDSASTVYLGLDDVDVEMTATTVTPPPAAGVPEPAPLALLGLGAIGALAARRRRRPA